MPHKLFSANNTTNNTTSNQGLYLRYNQFEFLLAENSLINLLPVFEISILFSNKLALFILENNDCAIKRNRQINNFTDSNLFTLENNSFFHYASKFNLLLGDNLYLQTDDFKMIIPDIPIEIYAQTYNNYYIEVNDNLDVIEGVIL